MEARTVPQDAATGRAPQEAATGKTLSAPDLRASRGVRLSARGLRAAGDSRLVELVRKGQAAAFEEIYDRYHQPIFSFCRRLLRDSEEAADAAQQTFLAAYSAIVSTDKALLLRAWLFTIARNRCYSMLRAHREQPADELTEPVSEGLAAHVLRREDLRQLLVDMRRLPDDQRTALVLAELGTLNHREIGSALGVPSTKVKALVFQARESLLAARQARETDCHEIRQQLSTLSGAALRRGNLRRHLRVCAGCREFQLEHQPTKVALPDGREPVPFF